MGCFDNFESERIEIVFGQCLDKICGCELEDLRVENQTA
jgi:hypothetical protein